MQTQNKEEQIKKENKLYEKALSKMFDKAENPIKEITENIFITDVTNVFIIKSKNIRGQELLRPFKEKDDTVMLPSGLEWTPEKLKEQTGKFSCGYLIPILKILSVNGTSVQLTLKTDYPLKLENEDFLFILAPRVSND